MTLERVEEDLVDAKRTGIPFPATNENLLRVTSPGDLRTGG